MLYARKRILQLAVLLAAVGSLTVAGVAMAHGGPGHHARGVTHHRAIHHHYYYATGWVTASPSATTLSVRSLSGRAQSFAITTSTKFVYGGGGSATAADARLGAVVSVRGTAPTTSGGNPVATKVIIGLGQITGMVLSDSSGTLKVADTQGFTRTVATTSSSVCQQRRKTTVDCDSIAQGSIITARGRIASDGTTLNASRIHVVPPRS